MVICPAATSFVFDAEPGKSTAVVTWPPITYSDNVGVVSALYLTSPPGLTSGTRTTVGITDVTFVASDAAGNYAQCQFTVTVVDTQPPTIACPGSFSIWCPPPTRSANVTWMVPTFADNVGLVSTSVSLSPGVFSAGTYTAIASATDTSGNDATCSFSFAVLTDTTPPTITPCPPTQILNTFPNKNYAVVTWTDPVITDDLTAVTSQYLPAAFQPGSSFPVGLTRMKLIATDAYSNEQSKFKLGLSTGAGRDEGVKTSK